MLNGLRWRRVRRGSAVLLGSVPAALALFAVLESGASIRLTVELESELDTVALGQLFWATAERPFSEFQTAGFEIRPGPGTYSVSVPVDAVGLRLDPGQSPGRLLLKRITLADSGWTLARWDSRRGFDGWSAQGNLDPPRPVDGALELRATGADPMLVYSRPLDLRALRRPRAAAVALTAGLALALLLLLLHAGASAAHSAAEPRTDATRLHLGRARLALLLVSIAVSAGLGWLVLRAVARWRQPAAPIVSAGYDLSLVDSRGRLVGEHAGNLRLQLDPFTLYRNLPGQEGGRFRTGEHGVRLPFDPADPRPRVVILGGSMAFGYGLERDEETFSARLGELDPTRQYVNAAVIGFLSGQELNRMLHLGDRLEARAYLLVDGWNELYVQLFPGYDGAQFGYNRHILNEIEERLRQAPRAKTPPAWAEPAPPAPLSSDENRSEILESYTRNLGRMADLARARGAVFAVVFQPFLGRKASRTPAEEKAWSDWQTAYPKTHADFTERYAELIVGARAFCERRGIAHLDLEADERFRDGETELFLDAVHLNAEGHRRLAQAAYELLQQEFQRASETPSGD